MNRSPLFVGLALALLAAPEAAAQKLYGLSGPTGTVIEFPSIPGVPCAQPTGPLVAWPYVVPPPCPGPVPGFLPAPGVASIGDVATNSLTNTVFVATGMVVAEYADATPFPPTAAGTPINSFPVPFPAAAPPPLRGLGMDELGVTTFGIPALWATNGAFIWAFAPSPPGSCAAAPIVVPPFPSPFPVPVGMFLTDVTVDPSTGSLLLCDSAGMIHSVMPGGAPGPYGFFPVPAAIFGCGAGAAPLQGLSMDLATTPSVFGTPAAFFLTNGFSVVRLSAAGGALLPPTFYWPVPCSPTPAPISGLAFVNHSITYGAPPGAATLSTFGQPSSPGPTYGVTLAGVPVPAFAWLVYGVNIPGPGFFCPPLFAVGNPLYVDPFTPPGTFAGLFPVPAGTTSFPAAIPPALPAGVEVYFQMFLDLTPTAPGGPWLSTNAVDLVITAP